MNPFRRYAEEMESIPVRLTTGLKNLGGVLRMLSARHRKAWVDIGKQTSVNALAAFVVRHS